MTFKNLPIEAGINLAGSICSIIAILMTFSIKFNIIQWIIVILGFTFGVFVLGMLISCVKYSTTQYKWLQPVVNNPFGLIIFWAVSLLASLFISLILGMIFGSGCYVFYIVVSDALAALPNAIRIR